MARVDPECDTVSFNSSTTSRVSTRFLTVVCSLLAVSCLALGTYVLHDKMTVDQTELLHHGSDQTIDIQHDTLESKVRASSIIDKDEKEEAMRSNICYTTTCIVAASNLIQSLNKSMVPCDNFYEFACGNWANNQVVPAKYTSWSYSTYDQLLDLVDEQVSDLISENTKPASGGPKSFTKVHSFYKSCMDEAAIKTAGPRNLVDKMKPLGGFPMITRNWNEGKVDVLDLSIKLRAMDVNTLFRQVIRPDYKRRTYRILVDIVRMNIANFEYKTASTMKRYEQFIVDLAVAMKGDETTARRDAKDMIAFEKKLSAIKSTYYGPSHYREYTLKSWKTHVTDKFRWNEYFNKQLRRVGKPDVTDDTIVIYYGQFKYFEDLMNLLEATPKRTLVNYQLFNLVYKSVDYLGNQYRELYEKFIGFKLKHTPRKQVCEYRVSYSFKRAISRMFVDKYFHNAYINVRNDVIIMFDNVRIEFINMVENKNWMDSTSRKGTVDKVIAMRYRIGYPKVLMNDVHLDKLYSKLEVHEGEYVANIYSFWENRYIKNLQKMDTKVIDDMDTFGSRNELWNIDITRVKSFYDVLKNRISFPAANLQVPFYNARYPGYLNYAAIGTSIGHEITHGFDNNGRQYDKDGKTGWWSPNVIKEFEKRAQCFIKQYSEFIVPEVGIHVNGNITLNGNIADNAGLKESFKAYRMYVASHRYEEDSLPGLNMSPNQLFFLHTAQIRCRKIYVNRAWKNALTNTHSPNRYRILGMMANSPDFAKAYNCPVGSKMNPAKKCELW